ncbi:MAG: VWA domain-containing protein [Alphaproteobacteria bacterium]
MSASHFLATNIIHFVRVLRHAGLPIGSGRALEAVRAVECVGISRRDDVYWALYATLIDRPEYTDIFDQAFRAFWRNPQITEQFLSFPLPDPIAKPPAKPINRRVEEAMHGGANTLSSPNIKDVAVDLDAAMTFSSHEQLRIKDFEAMSQEELYAAKAAIAKLRLTFPEIPTRRFRSKAFGSKVDLRSSFRLTLRKGGDLLALHYKHRRTRKSPLVVLCDISGSMERYSRLMLHFLHTLINDRDHVFVFLFGTRLSHITRMLHYRDVDQSLNEISRVVPDWSGGTRIGACLSDFNRLWARRTLSHGGATVLFISDGLDRDAGHGLAQEMERLQKSCRKLIWLNPLLRYEGFAPISSGNRVIIPYVDELRPIHNLASMAQLATTLMQPISLRNKKPIMAWPRPERNFHARTSYQRRPFSPSFNLASER